MRNLKRALSLALASIMLVGMMAVGTSAASYPDVDSTNNEEAIAVLQAAGVMTGDDKGNFNPDQKVTRNEMAVVMNNLLALDADDFAGAAPFTDVPAWAEKYVSACYANGIVSGASATEYNGAASVTAVEAGLMVMKALGYFEFSVDFGDNWKLATIKQASLIDLFEGINASADQALTRDEVAQLVLNALESVVVVGYQNGNTTSITAGDVSIKVEGKTEYVEQKNEIYYNGDQKDVNEYLIEKLYGEQFTVGSDKDAMDMPGYSWQDTKAAKDEQEIIFIADEADYILTAEETTDAVALFKAEVDKKFDGQITADVKADAGDQIHYFKTGTKEYTAVAVDYELYKVKEISTKNISLAEKEKGITSKITLAKAEDEKALTVITNKDFADFDYAKDEYILAVVKEKKVLASEAAESFEGKIESITSKGLNLINGEYYDAVIETARKDEAVWYLNKAGQICFKTAIDKNTDSSDYAVIYSIVDTGDGESVNADGIKIDGAAELTAYVVLADGTKASYVINEKSVGDRKAGECFEVIAYSVNKDGELVIEKAKSTIGAAAEITVKKDTRIVKVDEKDVRVNSKTEFVFVEKNDKNKIVVSTAAGVANVDLKATSVVIYNKDGEATLVFVNDAVEVKADDTKYYAFVKGTEYASAGDEDKKLEWLTYSNIDGAKDGLKVEVKDNKPTVELTKGMLFTYKLDDNGFITDVNAIDYTKTVKVEYVGEGFYTIGGKDYVVADNAKFETIIVNYKVEDDTVKIDSYEVAETSEADLVKDAELVIVDFKAEKDKDTIIKKAYFVSDPEGLLKK